MLKSKLVNLYIYPAHYNESYNFYNYHKFKVTRCINIYYKSPSIFLNGLYFELPYAQILQIDKPANSTNFNLTVQINPASFAIPSVTAAEIHECFEKIDRFNQSFFGKHGAKLEIRPRRTLKSVTDLSYNEPSRSGGWSDIPTNNDMRLCEPARLGSMPMTQSANRFTLPVSKNPISRKFTYEPFFTVDATTGVLTMQLEIKHIYLQRIFQALQCSDNVLEKTRKEMLEFINQEFFDFKRSEFNMNTRDTLVIPIRFWIKSNMFVTDASRLLMKWKICDFAI